MHDPALSQPPSQVAQPRQTRQTVDETAQQVGSMPELERNPYAHTTATRDTPIDEWDEAELRRLRDNNYHPLQQTAEQELQERQQQRLPHWDEKRSELDEIDETLDLEQQRLWEDERMLLDESADITEETAATESGPADSASIGTSSEGTDLKYLAMTFYPLTFFDRLDYISKCKHCESRPYSEGPHHDDSCPRHDQYLRYDTHHATRKYCKHEDCGAQPFIAGFHHRKGCPRGFNVQTNWDIADDGYNTPCICGAKPYSEGPHHSDDCKYYTDTPQFRTQRALSARCSECRAKPFAPGPHHEQTCSHHIDAVPMPAALQS